VRKTHAQILVPHLVDLLQQPLPQPSLGPRRQAQWCFVRLGDLRHAVALLEHDRELASAKQTADDADAHRAGGDELELQGAAQTDAEREPPRPALFEQHRAAPAGDESRLPECARMNVRNVLEVEVLS